MMYTDPPYPEIWRGLCEARVIPLLGAAPNYPRGDETWDYGSADLPTAADLSRYLAHLANFPQGEPTDDLAKVAEYYRLVVGQRTLDERLHEIFAPEYPCGPLHELLAGVEAPLLIVTTNWDCRLEDAFRRAGRPFDLVIHTTGVKEWDASVLYWQFGAAEHRYVAPKRLEIDLERTTVIYKMHGAVDRAQITRDSYVITEGNYVDFMVRMATRTAIPAIFAEPFRDRSFLFLGYSLRDWNLRVLLAKLAQDLRRMGSEVQPSWAIQYQPSALDRELWGKRNVALYSLPIHEFVQNLKQAVQIDRKKEHV